jgi:2-oxoisovalerate dehydrogenase E2 component (dihydrolipoyl transacylase)
MGAHVIKVPDIGEGIAEVELVAWHVQVGDTVTPDQTLADVMTEKATVEIPSPVAGRVLTLGAEVGQTMAVGAELIRIEVDAASASAMLAAPAAPAPDEPKAVPKVAAPASRTEAASKPTVAASSTATSKPAAVASSTAASKPAAPAPSAAAATPMRVAPSPAATTRPIASPALRRRAWELGIDLKHVHATGLGGRIVQADLDAHVAAGGARATTARGGGGERHDESTIPVIGLRRRIAVRMQEAKHRIPHFAYVEEIDVTDVEALRAALNAKREAERGRLTLLPLLIRAIVLAVAEFPQINARFDDEAGVVTRYGAVHVGIATQTQHGLMVPVLRHAEALDLWTTASEVARLAEAARSGRASRDELAGSTITISSLGALGGIASTPVINRPEVAIVAVNRIVERPVLRAGAVVARSMMNLSSSFDHRVVDGIDAARFVQAMRTLLEAPAMLFVD